MVISIHTDLVELRTLREEDRAEFVRMHEVSREHFAPWMPEALTWQTFDELFDQQLTSAEAGTGEATVIRMAAWTPDGRMAGLFSLSHVFRGALQNAYAGWRVSADQVGRGIGTSGVIGLLDLAFAPGPRGLGLHRVQANVIPTNAPSVRVAEKAGFRLEGRALRYLKIAGEWRDHLMFAKLVDEHVVRFFE